MEKRTPHCKLALIKAFVKAGKVRITASATADGEQLGFDTAAMVSLVAALTPSDFYKSMTTQADHTIWQDVYKKTSATCDVYLKLTVIHDVLIVSFKEL